MERIDPATYPKFRNDKDHPLANMTPDQRKEEIDSFCAKLWARICQENVRNAGGERRPNRSLAA